MFGYFESMRVTERAVEDSGLPWTILRATQFFDAVALVARVLARLPVVPVAAGVRFQPVDTGEVASRLVELALGTPHGLAPDLGGPTAYPMADLLTGYLRTVGKRRPLVPVRLPGKLARIVRAGANLPPRALPWAIAPGRSSSANSDRDGQRGHQPRDRRCTFVFLFAGHVLCRVWGGLNSRV
jgi:uncharacterized protein YbjT (DUF2867 family)